MLTRYQERRTRILAIASAGGHWVQLRRLRPAWVDCDVAYATSNQAYRDEILSDGVQDGPTPRFYLFPEATRWNKVRLLGQLLTIAAITICERPDVVISTGASAGYFALRVAKFMRRNTVWVDSIANASELSLAGKKVGPYADLWLTQWPHLAEEYSPSRKAPLYRGSVI